MFRTQFLSVIWEKGRVDMEELAVLMNAPAEIIMTEANVCAEQGWIRVLDSLVIATPQTAIRQEIKVM
ncbi:hypothetical protein [Aneurinibacillus terranovensis]|uniref:hypothetical protein n=1 Tax=Aneurinibacillus terranovensis TaxID=278991 RepID=UPI00047FB3B0|nr:hypothetical protein [Aneurinibacillus terranovensis]